MKGVEATIYCYNWPFGAPKIIPAIPKMCYTLSANELCFVFITVLRCALNGPHIRNGNSFNKHLTSFGRKMNIDVVLWNNVSSEIPRCEWDITFHSISEFYTWDGTRRRFIITMNLCINTHSLGCAAPQRNRCSPLAEFQHIISMAWQRWGERR